MRYFAVIAILLASITIFPAFCQEAGPVDPAAVVPGMPVVAPPPAPEAPQAEWTEAVPADVAPIAEMPVPVVVSQEPPVNPEPAQNWIESQENNVPEIKYVNFERNELLDRIVKQQIYVQRDINGNPLVPEPSSFIAMAVGLSGMVATISRRRKK